MERSLLVVLGLSGMVLMGGSAFLVGKTSGQNGDAGVEMERTGATSDVCLTAECAVAGSVTFSVSFIHFSFPRLLLPFFTPSHEKTQIQLCVVQACRDPD